MRRVLVLMLMVAGLLVASKGTASALDCEVYMTGTAKDVYNNTVSTAGNWLYLGHWYTDPNTCLADGLPRVNTFAYQTCLNRPSAVGISMTGYVYYDHQLVNGWFAPNSCRTAFGLNYYTPLGSGQSLYPGNNITDGGYELIYQTDTNFVLYNPSATAIWAINCRPVCNVLGNNSPGVATMQSDGNLVVYDSVGTAVWDSQTYGAYGAFLALRNGQLRIFATNGNTIWQAP